MRKAEAAILAGIISGMETPSAAGRGPTPPPPLSLSPRPRSLHPSAAGVWRDRPSRTAFVAHATPDPVAGGAAAGAGAGTRPATGGRLRRREPAAGFSVLHRRTAGAVHAGARVDAQPHVSVPPAGRRRGGGDLDRMADQRGRPPPCVHDPWRTEHQPGGAQYLRVGRPAVRAAGRLAGRVHPPRWTGD